MFKAIGAAIAFAWAFFFSNFATTGSPYSALTTSISGYRPFANDTNWYGGVAFSVVVGFIVGYVIDKMIAKNKKPK